jgi:hypothetical protein
MTNSFHLPISLRGVCALCLLFSLNAASRGQALTATLTGQVSDAAGAALAGARVVALHTGTNVERAAVTDRSGAFVIPLLPIGAYEVSAELAGFKKELRRGLVLQVDQKARLDFHLPVGALSEVVTVAANGSLMQTETASAGTVIDNRRVVELPLNSREFTALALLVPGVLQPAQGARGSRASFNAQGSADHANNFTLDGVDNNELGLNVLPTIRPSLDGIQEFKLLTGTYAAEYGRNSGAQVIVTTKAGTNAFHGTAFEFLRNQVFDARNFFAPPGQPAPSFKRNQFGGSLGGPLVKNKTFFFGNYEGLRLRNAVTARTTVPTLAMSNGDFRGLPVRVLNPFTGRDFTVPNVIDANLISPIGQALARFYPAPTRATATGALPSNNYDFNATRRETVDQFVVRVNHTFSPQDSFSGVYHYFDNPRFEPAADSCAGDTRTVPGFGCFPQNRAQLVSLVYTRVFSPRLMNELRLGYNRFTAGFLAEDRGIDFVKQFNIPGTFFAEVPNNGGVPATFVTGFATIGSNIQAPQERSANTFQIIESLLYTRAQHSLKFGADLRNNGTNSFLVQLGRGRFNFTAAPTALTSGYALADLLLGLPTSTQRNPRAPNTYGRSYAANFYAQDDWKATPRLTLNLGLRYEFNSPNIDKRDIRSGFDPRAGQIIVAGQNGVPRNLYRADKNDFAPRLGFAWQPFGDARTVVRGGFGIYYNIQFGFPNANMGFNFPFRQPQTFNSSRTAPLRLSDPFPGVAPAGTLTVTSIAPDFRTALVNQWSLSLQRELAPHLAVEASYFGSKGTRLPLTRNLNQPTPGQGTVAVVNARRPYPAFGNITWLESVGNSNYNALQLKLEGRYAQSLSLLAAYTFGKSLDSSPGFSALTVATRAFPQDTRNLRAEYGRSDFDVRQRFVFNSIYELPLGHGHKLFGSGPLAYLAGGWQVSGILTLQGGRPITVYVQANQSNTFNNSDRPNLVGDPNSGPRTVEQWFNTAAFQVPRVTPTGAIPPGNVAPLFGNAGRNIVNGPGYANVDFALHRRFQLWERLAMQFRAELFNAFNHPNFNLPVAVADDTANFGKITSALNPRQIQFGLKLIF